MSTRSRVRHSGRLGVLFILMLIAFGGCGPAMQELELGLHSTNRLNLTPGGQPAPVVVRIYTLRASDRFASSTFQDLWKRDDDVLGDQLLRLKEVTLLPDQTQEFEFEFNPEKDERFVGVMALFRERQGEQWRTVIPITEPGFFSFGPPEYRLRFDEGSVVHIDD